MILITSAAYISPEFISEIGKLPPSFLPVSNKRLFELQLDLLKSNFPERDIYISVPETYSISNTDQEILNNMGAKVLSIPDGLSLGESVKYAWDSVSLPYEELSILHGDTLIVDTPLNLSDSISVHPNKGYYQRAFIQDSQEAFKLASNSWAIDMQQVISGWFSFESPKELMHFITKSENNFMDAVFLYFSNRDLKYIDTGKWLDFGHLNSYFQSRSSLTTQRSFNTLSITKNVVLKKSSLKSKKIECESSWFESLPIGLRKYTPAYLGRNESGYELEYLYLLPLNDMYVYGNIASRSWKRIFTAIHEMLGDFKSEEVFIPENESILDSAQNLYLAKTLERLNEFKESTQYDIHETLTLDISGKEYRFSLTDIAKEVSKYINPTKDCDIGIIHGDLCFSNILFDQRSSSVKCIDPRGYLNKFHPTILGDRRYDIAKLYHSVVGYYDLIISERASLMKKDSGKHELNFFLPEDYKDVEDYFNSEILDKTPYSRKEIHAICINLFLSMLPLHDENPQKQELFIANAKRLFKSFILMPS